MMFIDLCFRLMFLFALFLIIIITLNFPFNSAINFNVLYQRGRYYANTDGNRGKAASAVLYYSVQSFSIALSDALVDGWF